MRLRFSLPAAAFAIAAGAIPAADSPPFDTTAGWVKHPRNPLVGGKYGTCFDVSVLKQGDSYRMWLSWRPKQCLALVESNDGVNWSEPPQICRFEPVWQASPPAASSGFQPPVSEGQLIIAQPFKAGFRRSGDPVPKGRLNALPGVWRMELAARRERGIHDTICPAPTARR